MLEACTRYRRHWKTRRHYEPSISHTIMNTSSEKIQSSLESSAYIHSRPPHHRRYISFRNSHRPLTRPSSPTRMALVTFCCPQLCQPLPTHLPPWPFLL